MKNAPFYALVGVVAIVLGSLIMVIFLQAFEGSLPENTASTVCTITFLIIAMIAYELIAKPGVYFKRRRKKGEQEEKEEAEKEESKSP